MKKLFIGMVIGALITCGVFYFIGKNNEDEQKDNVTALLELMKQNQAASRKMNEAINDSSTTLAARYILTIVVRGSDEFYYYRDKDCSKIEKINMASANDLLSHEAERTKDGDLMILIKMMPGTDSRNAIRLLDAIGRAGIQPGHYAEIDLSENEKDCIKNYKQR